MTINRPKRDWKLCGHQVILLDEQGRVCESCDTIFDTKKLISDSICSQICFLESEFEVILNSSARKITFEKMQTECNFLPGYYDFTFCKQEINKKPYVIWEIYDHTKVYEQYINVQQITNELDIHQEFQNRKSKPLFPDSFLTKNFFQSSYLSKDKTYQSYLIDDLIRSKFDVFDLMVEQDVNQILQLNPSDLKESLKILINEISTFLKHIKQNQEDWIDMRSMCQAYCLSAKRKMDVVFDPDVPQKVFTDANIIRQLVALLCGEKSNNLNSKLTKMNVSYCESILGGRNLVFCFQEPVDDIKAFLNSSADRVIKLSVLKSLLSLLSGTLSSEYLEDDLIFSVSLTIPVK